MLPKPDYTNGWPSATFDPYDEVDRICLDCLGFDPDKYEAPLDVPSEKAFNLGVLRDLAVKSYTPLRQVRTKKGELD